MKKTKKYVEACKVLGLSVGQSAPHKKVYGIMALHEYEWNGEEWKPTGSQPEVYNGSLRVSAQENDAALLAETLAQVLGDLGMKVGKVSKPYPNAGGNQHRVYINFTYRK